jgi:hypothetical protein
LLGQIEWAAFGKQVFPGRPAITPQIAMKPATLCFVFDPGFVRSAYVRLCVDSERSVSSGLGRKPKLTEHQKREAIRRRDHDGEPVREIARTYNVSHSTISRLEA